MQRIAIHCHLFLSQGLASGGAWRQWSRRQWPWNALPERRRNFSTWWFWWQRAPPWLWWWARPTPRRRRWPWTQTGLWWWPWWAQEGLWWWPWAQEGLWRWPRTKAWNGRWPWPKEEALTKTVDPVEAWMNSEGLVVGQMMTGAPERRGWWEGRPQGYGWLCPTSWRWPLQHGNLLGDKVQAHVVFLFLLACCQICVLKGSYHEKYIFPVTKQCDAIICYWSM